MSLSSPLTTLSAPCSFQQGRAFLRTALSCVTASTAQCHTETDWLLAHATKTCKTQWLTHPHHFIAPAALAQLNQLFPQRVLQRCPIQYLLGEAFFYGLTFCVSPAVLIPRPETELLVEAAVTEALQRLKHTTGLVRIVDVGTGSGCIIVAVGHALRSQLSKAHWQRVKLLAVDCSEEALAVARQNAEKHDMPVTFYQGSWLEPLLAEKISVEMMVSNPPYIPSRVCDGLEPEVISHEPRLALDGGPDGLGPYRVLLAQAQQCLAPNGWVGLEFGDGQAPDIVALARNTRLDAGFDAGFAAIQVHPDFSGIERFLTATQG